MHDCIVAVAFLAICLLVSISGTETGEFAGYAEKVRSLKTEPRHSKGRHAIETHLTALLEMGVGADSGGGIAALGFPRTGLNVTCNNALCELLETALSCKGLGFHLSKVCTQYVLGFLYNCPVFPSPSELFNAPSVCLGELKALLPPDITALLPVRSEAPVDTDGQLSSQSSIQHVLRANGDSEDTEGHNLGAGIADSLTFSNVRKYLASDFAENCGRRCFQKYIAQSTDFYAMCTNELLQFTDYSDNSNSEYPIPYILSSYEEFRNQVCVMDHNGTNCFSTVQQFLPDPTGQKEPADVDIFKYDCKWFDENDFNALVFDGICTQLQDVGCCFGNQVAMLAQSQTNQSANTDKYAISMFQPCLLRNLNATCSQFLDPTTFCTKGANGNMTTITGSVVMGKSRKIPRSAKILNVYNESLVVEFQGVMSLDLLWDFDSPTRAPALQVEVLNYAYFSSSIEDQGPDTQLTPQNGSLYYPYQGDFELAESARIDWQFVLQGKDHLQSALFYEQLTQEKTCAFGKGDGILKFKYGDQAKCVNVSNGATIFNAEPIIPPAKSSAYRGVAFNVQLVAALVVLGQSLNLLV